jgi:hypothetical protein
MISTSCAWRPLTHSPHSSARFLPPSLSHALIPALCCLPPSATPGGCTFSLPFNHQATEDKPASCLTSQVDDTFIISKVRSSDQRQL